MRHLTAGMIVLVLLLLAAPADSQPVRLNAMVCRDIMREVLGAEGSRLVPRGCGREFSLTTPHVVLYFEVAGIDRLARFQWELLDPTGTVVASSTLQIDPPGGRAYTYTIYRVVPVAATPAEIVAQNPTYRFAMVNPRVPVTDGEWQLRASLDRYTITTRFVFLKP